MRTVAPQVKAPAAGSYEPASERLSRRFDRGVSLLAWGYNEEKLVKSFLDRAVGLLEECAVDWEIVFVDDCSTDRTGSIVDEYARDEPRLRVIHNEKNLNVGLSCRRAIQNATKDYLFWQTVDWSYDIANLRIFLELTRDYDVVQGVRPTPARLLSYVPVLRSLYRVRKRSDNFRKAIVSLSNYYVLRILFGAKFHDFQNVSIYPTSMIQSFELRGESSFLNPECLFRALERGASFIEVPISFVPRAQGQGKGTRITSIIKSLADIGSNWLDWGWRFRLERAGDASRRQIHRVSEPFHLDEDVAELVVPLFQEFR